MLGCFSESLSAVNLTSSGLNSDFFLFIVGFVISAQNSDGGSSVNGHDASTVSNVDDIGDVIDNHHHGGTGP